MGNKKLAILFFLSVLLAFFAGYFSSNIIENQSSVYSSDMFTSITDAFEQYYYYDIEDEEVNRAFIASMEAIIDQYALDNHDPYTKLREIPINITPANSEQFEGLGITFTFNQDYELVILDVMMESSVYGLIFPNDVITGMIVNDERVMFNTLQEDDVVAYFSGVANETKQLIVVNPDGQEEIIDATYQVIDTPTAYSVDLDHDDIAYVKITEFAAYERNVTVGTSQVFNTLLVDLETSVLTDETKTLIIDLRDNPGGALSALNSLDDRDPAGITQQLLMNDAQPIFTLTDNEGTVTPYYGRLSEPKTYDIRVLVNEHSASAAEVLAAALLMAGYSLYGEQTYGKGVYQNTIFLSEILNVNYYLTYTEGTWQYGDELNVMDSPLNVNPIAQSGMYTIDMPVYTGEVARDEVAISLGLYQAFLNEYFNYQDENILRTDGYFDMATEGAMTLFQQDMGLPETGILDIATAQAIYMYYKSAINDLEQDAQLQTLISLIEG